MKKYIFILFLLMVASVTAIDITVDDTVENVGEPIFLLYNMSLTVDDYAEIGVESIEGEKYICYNETADSTKDYINQRCSVEVNDSGKYSVYKRFNDGVDDNTEYIKNIDVKHATMPVLGLIFAIMMVLSLVLAIYVHPVMYILMGLFAISTFVSFMFRYQYTMNDGLFFGILTLIFLGLLAVIERILRKLL